MQQSTTKNASGTHRDEPRENERGGRLSFLLDLDGTLVDSVYQHVLSWQEAFKKRGLEFSAWRIHRRVGMSGGELVRALLRESGREGKEEEVKQLEQLHGEAHGRLVSQVRPLPGARELLKELSRLKIPWAIVTNSRPEKAQPVLQMLNIESEATVVTRGEVSRAKPEPDPFLVGARRLGVKIGECVVVGDSVWDLLSAQRARALAVGLLAGGNGRDELERAGAYRVYQDPADLLQHLDELGIRGA
ncbi:MAG TPA: HAD family hydrolase [Gemmataceae bacterium]|jgi:HAD superfamily hydrolase (TIGR01509 family)